MNDTELLKAFVERRDPDAFHKITARYTGIVYGIACRRLGDRHLAEDVTQAVFIILSQRAHLVHSGASLAGWLVNTARLAALSAARNERRLKHRERQAAMTKPTITTDETPDKTHLLALMLDEALCRLRPKDRTAVTLRYIKGMSTVEVAATMGVSEAAAAKRVSRAVSRLRVYFDRRGLGASVASAASLESAFDANSAFSVPPGLADLAATSALAYRVSGVAGNVGTAHLIAHQMIAVMKTKALVAKGLAVVLTLLIVGGASWTMLYVTGGRRDAAGDMASDAPAAAVRTAAILAPDPGEKDWLAAATHPIKVGVILSDFTATSGFGYGNQSRILDELHDPGFQLEPIVEPGTEAAGPLALLLQKNFPNVNPIDGYDSRALRQLDVIVAAQVFLIHDEMVSAITDAVNDGVGLLIRQGLGDFQPGYTPNVNRLHGLTEGVFGETVPWRNPIQCEFVGEHAIVGRQSQAGGASVWVLTSGAFGPLTPNSTPLIVAKANAKFYAADNVSRVNGNWPFCALYVSSLGRGKIIGCSFDVHAPPPTPLLAGTGGRFSVRCVQWLAVRHADAATQPATLLASP